MSGHFFCNLVICTDVSFTHPAVAGIVRIADTCSKYLRKAGDFSVCLTKNGPSIRCDFRSGTAGFHRKYLTPVWLNAFWRKLQLRNDKQRYLSRTLVIDAVRYGNQIFPLFHRDFFCNFHAVDIVSPRWIIFKTKGRQMVISVLTACFIHILLTGQTDTALTVCLRTVVPQQPFHKAVYHIVSVIGRPDTCHQKRVIVPRIGARHAGAGKTAQSIRKQIAVFLSPFPRYPVLCAINKFHICSIPLFFLISANALVHCFDKLFDIDGMIIQFGQFFHQYLFLQNRIPLKLIIGYDGRLPGYRTNVIRFQRRQIFLFFI